MEKLKMQINELNLKNSRVDNETKAHKPHQTEDRLL
jgi:hypothetical protein